MFALYILGTLLEPAIGTARFVGIYVVSILGGAFGALLLDPTELTVGASGGIFGLMAAAFLIARDRGLDELASQIGFFVIINLVFTFSIPGIIDRRPPRRPDRRRAGGAADQPRSSGRPPNGRALELGGTAVALRGRRRRLRWSPPSRRYRRASEPRAASAS